MDRPTTDNVTKHVIPTADEFIRKLSPFGDLFGGRSFPGGTFFRGHASYEWPLLPTALRQDTYLNVGSWTKGAKSTNIDQIRAEAELLWEFFQIADRKWVAAAGGLATASQGISHPQRSGRQHRIREATERWHGHVAS